MNLILNLEDKEFVDFFEKVKNDYPNRPFKKTQIEQIRFRAYICKSCIAQKKCNFCKCNPNDVLAEPTSCNHEKIFPNFMQEMTWNEFKKQHNITIL
jgi:hypothetical protein